MCELGVRYIDTTTYIDDLLHDGRCIVATDFTLGEAIMLSIRMDCKFELSFSDDRYREYARNDVLEYIRGECGDLIEDDCLGKFLLMVGKIYSEVLA